MEPDKEVLEYVAEKVLTDFRKGLLPDNLGDSFSRRPWTDVIRDKADASCRVSLPPLFGQF